MNTFGTAFYQNGKLKKYDLAFGSLKDIIFKFQKSAWNIVKIDKEQQQITLSKAEEELIITFIE